MTATDELKRLLDEREIMYKTDTFVIDADHGKVKEIAWVIGDSHYVYQEYRDRTVLTSTPITPEQAIAATLGSYEQTCEMYRDEHGIWHCMACERGADVITGNDGELDSWHDSWAPNYCPYCGRKRWGQ